MKDKNSLIALLALAALVGWGVVFLSFHQLDDSRINTSALQHTGVYGDEFEITLPDDKVAVAGTIVSADEAKEFYYERETKNSLEYDVVYRVSPAITPPTKVEMMRRMHQDLKK